jgi:hypothetical protein
LATQPANLLLTFDSPFSETDSIGRTATKVFGAAVGKSWKNLGDADAGEHECRAEAPLIIRREDRQNDFVYFP